MAESMTTVSVPAIREITARAMVVHGAGQAVADHVADAVAVAEANGNRICGLYYVESYCHQLVTGRVNGRAEPEVITVRPGSVRVDAKLGFAQPAFAAGLPTALASARANGICGYSLEHTHTCTALGYFTEQLARAGMLAIGATNASPRVAPPGGSQAVLGTNPIAMAVPDKRGGIAFQFDFSTSAVALGRITMAAAAGDDIPLGWAVDRRGRPTTDPGEALAGSLASAGGYKGFGFGLMVEMLAAGLTGGRLSVDVPPLKAPDGPPHDLGQFYIVIDPAAYSGDGFHERVVRLAREVAQQPGARLPGRARQPKTEVEVPDELWNLVSSLASR